MIGLYVCIIYLIIGVAFAYLCNKDEAYISIADVSSEIVFWFFYALGFSLIEFSKWSDKKRKNPIRRKKK